MIKYKNRGANQLGTPFPFSAYAIRSYSSDPADINKPRSYKNHKEP